jgi:hypothetical protein
MFRLAKFILEALHDTHVGGKHKKTFHFYIVPCVGPDYPIG